MDWCNEVSVEQRRTADHIIVALCTSFWVDCSCGPTTPLRRMVSCLSFTSLQLQILNNHAIDEHKNWSRMKLTMVSSDHGAIVVMTHIQGWNLRSLGLLCICLLASCRAWPLWHGTGSQMDPRTKDNNSPRNKLLQLQERCKESKRHRSLDMFSAWSTEDDLPKLPVPG